MRIAVVGAAGRTGLATVEEAARRGHQPIAVGRRTPVALAPQVEFRCADVTHARELEPAIEGADAVISAVGIGSSRGDTDLYSRGAANLLAAMRRHQVARLVVVSAAPAGPRGDHTGFEHNLVLPILERVYGASYRDMRKMETLLRASDREWVAVRPPRLVAKTPHGGYRSGERPPAGGRSITIGDLAAALVDCAETSAIRGSLYVSN